MLKARVSKISNKKLMKSFDYSTSKAYTLKDIDLLLNQLVENLTKPDSQDITLDIELVDADTKNKRWYIIDYSLTKQLIYFNNGVAFDLISENSMLKRIIQKDLDQDPDVDEVEKSILYKEFDESYEETNLKPKQSYIAKFFKKRKEEPEIEELEAPVELDIDHEETITAETNSDSGTVWPEFDDVLSEVPATSIEVESVVEEVEHKATENIVITSDYDEKQLPITLPTFKEKTIDRKVSDDPLTQLKYDLLFDRNLERESIRQRSHDSMISKLYQKYNELQKEAKAETQALIDEFELTDDELFEFEEERKKELDKELDEEVEKVKQQHIKELELFKKEIEMQIKEKESELNQKLDEKTEELILKQNEDLQKLVNAYLDDMQMEIELKVNNLSVEQKQRIKDELNQLTSELTNETNDTLMNFDKESFKILNSKIECFKDEQVQMNLVKNQQLELENEKLKLESSIKEAEKQEREIEIKNQQLLEEQLKVEKKREKNKLMKLEVEKEKQLYKNKMLLEREKENALKQQDIEMRRKEYEFDASKNIQKKPNYALQILAFMMFACLLVIIVFVILEMTGQDVISHFLSYNENTNSFTTLSMKMK
ncbi:TPA: hypothetical protein I1843_002124 [Staphylococcus pseudintermedius]|nr:hypothetical protein [Staphylococcus pseudintermedius]EGQ2706518.1 hypothetical protein [Staphylococcus pseudintermedius]EGQ3759461.1 hypothetical protein [Staphylococcus pseudintermedius]EGQ4066826.1 hypothetical protein [Staphylococcus pseudintermedius]MDF0176716.1 hypothetical protein [Staphylococcus pseudintermedius]